jgi:hypothetical protein
MKWKQVCAGFFVTLVVVGSGTFMVPKKAEAVFGIGDITFDPTNLVQNTIAASQSLVTAGLLSSLQLKELTLDGIAWSLAKKVLAQTTRSIIDWINSGFQGKPAFITDLDEYLFNAADEVATDFIAGENFSQLCKPLQMPVRFILDLSYRRARSFQERSQCTISKAITNIGNSVENSFEDGFRSWFEITTNPYNNIYGATVFSASAMRQQIEQDAENKKRESDWSNGWLSVKDCSSGKCVIVTPGNVISEYLNFSLTVGDRVLIEADDINEIIGALFAQLGKQAITGVGGLLGLSQSQGGQASYLSQFEQETIASGFAGGSRFITDAIKIEESYRALHTKALEDLIEVALEDAVDMTCAQADSIIENIETLGDKYNTEEDSAALAIELLAVLKESFDTATREDLQMAAVQQFQELQQDGTLHSAGDITTKTFEISDEITEMKELIANCN